MNYYTDLNIKLVYCAEHAPVNGVEVLEGHVYVSTLPYAGATVLCCAECGVEVWNAETVAAGEVSE